MFGQLPSINVEYWQQYKPRKKETDRFISEKKEEERERESNASHLFTFSTFYFNPHLQKKKEKEN